MRILVVHCRYQQRGGEDSVVDSEVELLRRAGHEVELFEQHNDAVRGMGHIRLAGRTFWSTAARKAVSDAVRRFDPAVAHIHNTFPLLSPSIYGALDACGVAVVQTMHNYRWLCPQAMFLRDGRVCEDCLGRVPVTAIMHGCYRGSRAKTAVLSGMLVAHRWLGTLDRHVDRVIALTEFGRQKFIEGGFAADRIVVKPNFVEPPPAGAASAPDGFLFVGRLSEEKGIAVLAAAAREVPELRITVVGTGPAGALLENIPNVRCTGALGQAEVMAEMSRAAWLIVPSIWYEGFPRTIVEAYAAGLPVLASRIGSLAEIVAHGRTGLQFAPADVADLARAMRHAFGDSDGRVRMGAEARSTYDASYSPAVNLAQLEEIYRAAIRHRQARNVK